MAIGAVAELADAQVSKTCEGKTSCGFNSHPRHKKEEFLPFFSSRSWIKLNPIPSEAETNGRQRAISVFSNF